MKKLWEANFAGGFMVLALSLTLISVSCQKKDDGGSSANNNGTATTQQTTYAQTPQQSCNMPGNPNCTPSTYWQYNNSQVNFQSYQWSNSNGFCGCAAGYRPVMNSSWGISCAPAGFFPNMNNGYGYYGYSYRNVYYGQYYAQNGQWSSIPQVAYNPAVYGANSNCYATAASVCDIRSNNCPGGSVCRATSGGSYLGICTYGTGVEYYGGGTAR